MPSASQTIAIVFAVNWPPQAPAPGHATSSSALELAVGHPAGGMRADRLEHVLNGHVAALELPGRNRSAVEHEPRHVRAAPAPSRRRESSCRSRRARRAPSNPLPRATSSIESAMTSRLTSEARIPSVPIVMPSEIETVLNSIGVPPAARMPSFTSAGQRAQVEVAGPDLDPGVGHADERLPQVGVGEAGGLQHGAGGRAARAGGQRVGSGGHAGLSRVGADRHRRCRVDCSSDTSRARAASARTRRGAPAPARTASRRARPPDPRRRGIPTCAPGIGRDSSFVRSMPRSANTLSALKSAPGSLGSVNTMRRLVGRRRRTSGRRPTTRNRVMLCS